MNKELLELFNGLNKLTDENEAFYFSEQNTEVNGKTYTIRSYTYRLATWSDFKLPYAKESRGTAFYKDLETGEWNLFCRAYKKFHNLGEGIPKEDFMEDNEPIVSYEKMDGSLILFGIIDNKVIAKSKTSINSDQAVSAQNMVDNDNDLERFIIDNKTNLGSTTVMELVGPNNVIVLRYTNDELVFLGVVDDNTGVHKSVNNDNEYNKLLSDYGLKSAKPYTKSWEELLTEQLESGPHIEGYVVDTPKGLVKVKVASYVALHHLKDNVNNIKNLTILILDDNLDDLIGSFRDDQETIDYILETQERISHKYNHLVSTVENIVKDDLSLERKEFAMKHQKDNKEIFGLLMSLYLGKNVNYNEYFMKNKMYE